MMLTVTLDVQLQLAMTQMQEEEQEGGPAAEVSRVRFKGDKIKVVLDIAKDVENAGSAGKGGGGCEGGFFTYQLHPPKQHAGRRGLSPAPSSAPPSSAPPVS